MRTKQLHQVTSPTQRQYQGKLVKCQVALLAVSNNGAFTTKSNDPFMTPMVVFVPDVFVWTHFAGSQNLCPLCAQSRRALKDHFGGVLINHKYKKDISLEPTKMSQQSFSASTDGEKKQLLRVNLQKKKEERKTYHIQLSSSWSLEQTDNKVVFGFLKRKL